MELGGGINFNMGNPVILSPVSNLDRLNGETMPLNWIGKEVDPFTNSDSRSPLKQMAKQLEDYEKLMDINDPKQVAFLKDNKALLERMRRNVEAGKTTLEEVNKYILDNLIQGISQNIEKLRDQGAAWFAITGTEELPSDLRLKNTDEAFEQDFRTAQNKLNKFLKNASPEEIAKVQSDREAAKQRAQQVGMQQDFIEVQNIIEVQNTDQALNEANKTAQDNLRADISDLEKELKNPNLTNEERQSYEQRIEKMKKAIEFLDKIKDDPEFKKKILSKLSPEEQERLLEDIKNKKLTKESIQAINIATAAAEVAVYKTQTINEGFFALSKQRKEDTTGMTHEEYYERYRVPMNLDKSEFIKTNIDLKVYSRDSAYDSSSYSSNNEKDPKNSNLSLEQKVEDIISELESRGELTPAEQNLTNKDIAQRLGLKPDHPIVLAIARGEYDSARELSIGLNLETSVNAIAAPTTDDQVDPWRVISLTPEAISSIDPLGGIGFLGLTFV
jgi:hypothetical protein